MINYFIGFLSALCLVRIRKIIIEYRHNQILRKNVIIIESREELEKFFRIISSSSEDEEKYNSKTSVQQNEPKDCEYENEEKYDEEERKD